MPNKIYSVKVGDKIYDIEGDRPPTQADVNRLLGSFEQTTSPSENVESLIESRGNLLDQIRGAGKNIEDPSFLKKGIGLIQGIGIPGQAIEAGISNPIIKLQQEYEATKNEPLSIASVLGGAKTIASLPKQAVLGLTGQKLGQYGDVARMNGAPEYIAAPIGLAASFAIPVSIVSEANKRLSGFGKMSDQAMKQAGNDIIEATSKAKQVVGEAVDNAYKPFENISLKQVNPSNPYVTSKDIVSPIEKLVDSLPPSLSRYIREDIGDELIQPTVATARKVKQIIGKFRPGIYGKDAKGVDILISDEVIKSGYKQTAEIIQDAVKNKFGERAAKVLRIADEKFNRLTKSVDYLKKNLNDSTLLTPTRTGMFGQKMKVDFDTAPRDAMTVLRKSGKESKRLIEDAYEAIKKFNTYQDVKGMLKHGVSAITYGGAIGAAGGAAAGKLLNMDR